MSAVTDIIRLGKQLAEAQEKIDRLASIDQAVAEAEARLVAVRVVEQREATKAAEARVAENDRQAGLAVQLDAMRAAAEAEVARKVREADERCKALVEAARLSCETYAQAEAAARERVETLEADEALLGQSVAALKSELSSIRSRLLG